MNKAQLLTNKNQGLELTVLQYLLKLNDTLKFNDTDCLLNKTTISSKHKPANIILQT